MVLKRNYLYEDTLYEGSITRKRIKSLILRVDPEKKAIRVSAPYHASERQIDEFVSAHLPRLLKRVASLPKPNDEDHTYFMGEKLDVKFASPKEETAYIKQQAMPYLEQRVRYYESIMGIHPPYKLRIRDMKSRYGSNSKQTHTLCFASLLFHYSRPTIDSVIVHELAHHFVRNHGKGFYQVVYTYCPTYKAEHKKLTKHIYE